MNQTNKISVECRFMEEVTSTNDALAQLCRKKTAKEFSTIIAESQTAGKGQRGNSWESEPGKNLTFSTVLFPTGMKAHSQFMISILASLSVCETLNQYTDGFSIKWPNDIYWQDKKIAGILIENELEGDEVVQSIIGIGLNINQETFFSSAPNPVSLKQIIKVDLDRTEILHRLLDHIMAYYGEIEQKTEIVMSLWGMYMLRQYRWGKIGRYKDKEGEFDAEIARVEPDGHLVLKDMNGRLRKYIFKEVQYIL